MIKYCSICNLKFDSLSSVRKYCGVDCRKKAQDNQRKKRLSQNKIIKLCSKCREKTTLSPYSPYCEECNKQIILEQKEKHKTLARKNSLKYYYLIKDNPEYKIKRNIRYKVYHKNRRENDIQFQIAVRLRNLLYQAMKRYTKDGKTFSSKKYGINFKEIIKSLEPFPEDINKWHIDHIKPLSLFNLEDKSQIKKAFSPRNLQWLPKTENLRKSNKF